MHYEKSKSSVIMVALNSQKGAIDINKRLLGVPVSSSPLQKSIAEFKRAALQMDSEMKVSFLMFVACCCLIHSFNFKLSAQKEKTLSFLFPFPIRPYKQGKFGTPGETIP